MAENDEAKSSGYPSRVGTAASRTYTPYSPFKVREGTDDAPIYPRVTPPTSGMTGGTDSRPWTTMSGHSGE